MSADYLVYPFQPVEKLLESGAFSDMKVVVGTAENKTTFNVHKAVLTANSAYFRNLLSGPNTQKPSAGHIAIELPEQDADEFALFLRWVYTTTVVPAATGEDTDTKSLTLYDYAKLVKVAKMYEAPSLSQHATAAFMQILADENLRKDYLPGGENEETLKKAAKLLAVMCRDGANGSVGPLDGAGGKTGDVGCDRVDGSGGVGVGNGGVTGEKRNEEKMFAALLKNGLLGPLFSQSEWIPFLHQYDPWLTITMMKERRMAKILDSKL